MFNTDYIKFIKDRYGVHTIVVDDDGQAWGRAASGADVKLEGIVFDTTTVDSELAVQAEALHAASVAIGIAKG